MHSSIDVARKAGVSQSTVSRVLNAPHTVSDQKVKKVQQAIKELRYNPNSIARSLVSKKTKTIALISGPLHNPYFVETTTSIVNYNKMKGYNTIVFFEDYEDKEGNLEAYQTALSMQVDGIILSSIYKEDIIYKDLINSKTPFIMFNRKHNKSINYVEIDNIKAGEIAAKHLIDYNHKKIGYIGGSLEVSTFNGRHHGFTQVLKNYQLYDKSLIFETNTSKESIKNSIHKMVRLNPTAIFAAADAIAIYVIDALIELGYSVPEDISVCGVDNVETATHRLLGLTTIGTINEENLGKIGIEHLIKMIEQTTEEKKIYIRETISPALYLRNTTKKI